MTHRIHTHVLGGLPVTVEFTISGPDPDTGIFDPWISDWCIREINHRPTKSTWVEERIWANPREESRLLESLLELASDE